jgi:type IV secretory pathway VirB4 component
MAKESRSTQQFVDVKEIRDGAVILKNGSLRKVLLVSGINFELKSEEEQNVIIHAYQNFLNSLDFSVQFVIHSRRMNIAGYLQKMKERQENESNELLKNQVSEYVEFIRSFVESNEIMAKTFFVVVPYDSISIPKGGKKILGFLGFGGKNSSSSEKTSDEQKMVQLNQRTDQVISGLVQVGLRAVPLNDEELIELFYNLYNPGSVEKKDLKIAEQ